MNVNGSNLELVYRGFKTVYNTAFEATESLKDTVAMTVTSQTAEEHYGWLGQFPDLREWVGDRILKQLSSHGFKIENKLFESAVVVKRTDMEDDRLGMYKPMFSEMGRTTKQHPDKLIFNLLKLGFGSIGFDGQFFSLTKIIRQWAMMAGKFPCPICKMATVPAGTYLTRLVRLSPSSGKNVCPMNFQEVRDSRAYNVVMRDEYIFGIRARVNCGYGLWQLAFGSKAPLTPQNYAAARKAMTLFAGDQGQPLGIKPTHLVVPPALEAEALTLLNAATIEGTSNIWQNTAKLVISPYVA